VIEDRPAQFPLLKIYDSLDPGVVRSIYGKHPVAANYTATLAVLYSHARKLAGSAAGSFLRPDSPRFATGIYLIHPYDPNKKPILFIHGLISSPVPQPAKRTLCGPDNSRTLPAMVLSLSNRATGSAKCRAASQGSAIDAKAI
jgi:hypothetical protein